MDQNKLNQEKLYQDIKENTDNSLRVLLISQTSFLEEPEL
jgi:hypothetical protein